ncbi:uncharacterized protein [Asterias amurensis]|uniref:uncharacterized protein n=1 Tax=Asterias amurensis TaxID=7602 RepID=UPI003AB542BB
MEWNSDYYESQWDYSQSDRTMHYVSYILAATCFVILVLAIVFLLRECCDYDHSTENSEMFILRNEESCAPNYTETTAEREQTRGHRIAHEFNRHQNVVLLSSAHSMANQPPPYYAYDTTTRATYYMYPTAQNTAGSLNAPTMSAQLVQRNYGETVPLGGTTARPPPYAPNHH